MMNWECLREDVWGFSNPADANQAYAKAETFWRSLGPPPPIILSLVYLKTGEHFVSLCIPPEVSQAVQDFVASLMEEEGGVLVEDQDIKQLVVAKAIEGFNSMINSMINHRRQKIKNVFRTWTN